MVRCVMSAKVMAMSFIVALVFGYAVLASTDASAQSALTEADYVQITKVILARETRPDEGPRTIFVGLSDIDADKLMPMLQGLYKPPTLLKGNGKDLGTGKGRCRVDKATGTAATGIFISSAKWRSPTTVAFNVTYSICPIGTYILTFIFEHSGGRWILQPFEPGPVS
jgi:hypothetical protein